VNRLLFDEVLQSLPAPSVDRTCDLGGCRVRFRVGAQDGNLLERFPTGASGVTTTPHVEVYCHDTVDLPDRHLQPVVDAAGTTVRGRGLRSGYYATDHFGRPVLLVESSNRFLVLSTAGSAEVVWSYLVKHLLLRWSLSTNSLFLKAAAADYHGRGALIIGQGGAGKTTLALALGNRGWRSVANSHVLIAGGSMRGVETAVRLRVDRLSPNHPAEVLKAPRDLFPEGVTDWSEVRAIWFVQQWRQRSMGIRQLTQLESRAALTHFALGFNVYRLEEDLMDDVAGDLSRFADRWLQMHRQVAGLSESVPCYLAGVDFLHEQDLASLARTVETG
jgi:hypothetical protein